MTGKIHSIETLGTLDGPGVRLVAFLAGCPLRCLYCHNPDTWARAAWTEMTPEALTNRAKRYLPYFKTTGGITLSGGEPLLQPEFVRRTLELCRKAGISTCVDTSGGLLNDAVKSALEQADLVILDVKHTEAAGYRALTGGDPETHRRFLAHCRENKIPLWIRQVIVPGRNDTPEDMDRLLEYIAGANVRRIELLPYHTLGVHKWEALGLPYALEGTEPPAEAQMEALRGRLRGRCAIPTA